MASTAAPNGIDSGFDPGFNPDALRRECPDWRAMCAAAGGFPIEAFEFVRCGLAHTVSRVAVDARTGGMDAGDARHVSGQLLCLGLRAYAIERYGLLAPAVLRHWNVRRTEDFGRIVYAMIEFGLMSKTSEDSFDDFAGVFDFDEAFGPTLSLGATDAAAGSRSDARHGGNAPRAAQGDD